MEYNLTSYANDWSSPSTQKFQKLDEVIEFLVERGAKNPDCHSIAICDDKGQDIGIFMADYTRRNEPLMHVFLDVATPEFLTAVARRFGQKCCVRSASAKIFKEFCTELAAIGT